jgi:uncharacterized protein GlcG (DUF336 family)
MSMTLERAMAVVDAGRRKAGEMGLAVNLAVVDGGCNLVAFARMDGAFLGSIDVALGKARTARAFDMETGQLAGLVQPGQPLFGLPAVHPGTVVFGGGIPLTDADVIVGAVGVSGGAVEQDEQVAAAAAAAF